MNTTHLGTEDFDLYCFDIDGTLIRSFMRENMPRPGTDEARSEYDRVEALMGRLTVLYELALTRKRFALVTNQGGVAMGYQTVRQVERKLSRVVRTMAFFYSRPFSVHCAYGHPDAKDPRLATPEEVCKRKPSPWMLEQAIEAHGVELARTLYVGDLDSDRMCAENAGVAYRDADEFFRA